jgi:G:T-mismatch repair DNA endonuclease (very short patch repair protein)
MLEMVDRYSQERRSEIMAMVRGLHTAPEIALRKLPFSVGFRYRLHARDLPGTPIVLQKTACHFCSRLFLASAQVLARKTTFKNSP